VGRLIGVAFALPFLYFLARHRCRAACWRRSPASSARFRAGRARWYMVESGLADRVEVSQYRLVAHLALHWRSYGVTLWIALDLLLDPPRASAAPIWRRAAEGGDRLIGLTILAGGFVAGSMPG